MTLKKAFTLIELLVVIGILAVLMAGVVALIDPVDKNRQANDSVMQSLIANAATAEEAYAAQHNGCYAISWGNLFNAGELKLNPANVPNGYAQPFFTTVLGACGPAEATSVIVSGVLQSKKYTSLVAPAGPIWKYETSSGKTCARSAIANACP